MIISLIFLTLVFCGFVLDDKTASMLAHIWVWTSLGLGALAVSIDAQRQVQRLADLIKDEATWLSHQSLHTATRLLAFAILIWHDSTILAAALLLSLVFHIQIMNLILAARHDQQGENSA